MALTTFCESGYRTATLETIGSRAGVTRGTVLHHFHSKAELLQAVAHPYLDAVDALLAATPTVEPPTRSGQRAVLTDLVDIFLAHRGALRLLANDIAARTELGRTDRFPARSDRMNRLLLGPHPTESGRVRVAAAMGALMQPCVDSSLALKSDQARGELVDAALAVLDTTTVSTRVPAARPARSSRRVAAMR